MLKLSKEIKCFENSKEGEITKTILDKANYTGETLNAIAYHSCN